MTAARAGAGRLRLTGGSRRGLEIRVPAAIRPTSSRLREALFNIWSHRVEGCSFLDLFAGSGAVGLEAASRGAARVVLVEGDRGVFTVLERNCGALEQGGVRALQAALPAELERALPAPARFDLVFADPPYGFAGFGSLLTAVEPFLALGGQVAVEHRWRDGEPGSPSGLTAVRSRRYGDSGLTLFDRRA